VGPPGTELVESTSGATTLDEQNVFHRIRVDSHGKLLSWTDAPSPYAKVALLATSMFEQIPSNQDGYPVYFVSAMFTGPATLGGIPDEPPLDSVFQPVPWVNNPSGLAAMLIDSGLGMKAFAGDTQLLDRARALADHVLSHGLTSDSDAWAKVAYSTADPGSLDYHGVDQSVFCMDDGGGLCGRGDGQGILEPDKVAEFGLALLRLYEGLPEHDPKYLSAALDHADALVKNRAEGSADASPWPFRVDAKTGALVVSPYTANMIAAVKLFDELIRIGQGDTAAYAAARDAAWAWIMAYPMKTGAWDGYFEDIATQPVGTNPTQYNPLELARYLLLHPDRDPAGREHAAALIDFATKTFAKDSSYHLSEPGNVHGAEVLSEQIQDMAKMGSHTARFASVLALYAAATGDLAARERAFRSFNWATYTCSASGLVKVGNDDGEGYWFTDGYGDWIRHFLAGMAAVPAWAPPGESHLLRTDSPVVEIAYQTGLVRYRTFSAPLAEDVLRVAAPVVSVTSGGKPLPAGDGPDSYTAKPIANGGYSLRIRRSSADVEIKM
jgi:hypothetical protein